MNVRSIYDELSKAQANKKEQELGCCDSLFGGKEFPLSLYKNRPFFALL